MLTARKVLNGAETVEDKIAVLAERFCDAHEWRTEESMLLDNFDRQLQELRERVESVASVQEVRRL